jgi:DNA-binding transcriptional ArsR family regulator
MTIEADIAAVGSLIGDPTRASILAQLNEGRALTAGELSRAAGVTPATASEHLARLTEGGLLTFTRQGRHRYYRIASRQVAELLEAMSLLAPLRSDAGRATPRVPPELRRARTCYDHIAGELGVGIADKLVEGGGVVFSGERGEVTPEGRRMLARLDLPSAGPSTSRRPYCRACTDWSERRPHIAGVLGRHLLDRTLELGWVKRVPAGRGLIVTLEGRLGFQTLLGLEV